MIIKPILIIGAPRSGTSLLQKILRNHPALWSLPSESELIWNQYCHPKLRGWTSEHLTAADITPEIKAELLNQFERYLCPAQFWTPLERKNLIWGFRRLPLVRKLLRPVYQYGFPFTQKLLWRNTNKRMIEKTTSNCLRLGFVNEVFPDARIIYITRDGRNNINSLLNAWLHPSRFFTYDVPAQMNISGYQYDKWKFVLPPGWRAYLNRSLEAVCAFQWQSCHQCLLAEIAKPLYHNRVLQLKLEALSDEPHDWIKKITAFVELPYDDYFQSVATALPIINSPDHNIAADKWQQQHRQQIERIIPTIGPTMKALGYDE